MAQGRLPLCPVWGRPGRYTTPAGSRSWNQRCGCQKNFNGYSIYIISLQHTELSSIGNTDNIWAFTNTNFQHLCVVDEEIWHPIKKRCLQHTTTKQACKTYQVVCKETESKKLCSCESTLQLGAAVHVPWGRTFANWKVQIFLACTWLNKARWVLS